MVGILLWWFSDSQVIKRNTRNLAATLTIKLDDNKSTRAMKSQDFSALLAPSFRGSVDTDNHQGVITKDEAISGHQFLAFKCQFSQANVSEIEITRIEDNRATVTAQFEISLTTSGGASYSDEADGTLVWMRTKDEIWVLESAKLERKSP
ncbi:hypothetical protein NT6N_05800 [Oceaniferula spumae]|uniref:Nuclear transport factor 2 family protein n=1 Tax=Oceaniferula spumae TaxID=2979115 RepID=A0AAT9FHZ7_9BACT